MTGVEGLLALRGMLDVALAQAQAAAPALAPAAVETPKYLSVPDFAARLQVSERTVRSFVAEGMPHLRPRRKLVRIDVAKAETWLAERSSSPSAAADAGRAAARRGK